MSLVLTGKRSGRVPQDVAELMCSVRFRNVTYNATDNPAFQWYQLVSPTASSHDDALSMLTGPLRGSYEMSGKSWDKLTCQCWQIPNLEQIDAPWFNYKGVNLTYNGTDIPDENRKNLEPHS